MQILVHIPIPQSILSGLLRRRDGRIEMLQLVREAHAHLKGIGHGDVEAAESDCVLGQVAGCGL